MLKKRPHEIKAARPRSGRRALRASPSERPADFPIVGIGASAGGLEACRKLVDALPAGNGMAFILVQHLDPTHESMMVELLADHTSMPVRQASEGMPIERDHLYVIPPGVYLSVGNGALRLSQPRVRHGARLPFDFLLHSLAEKFGARVICVILSGTGADGSVGLKAVRACGGHVVVQDPDEAGYDGMPRNAIMTGAVDLILPVAKIPEALAQFGKAVGFVDAPSGTPASDKIEDGLPQLIALLRTNTAHDFALYKPGTLARRCERRMAMAGVETVDKYLGVLRSDAGEIDNLAKDLLINVTGFFRDPKVFDRLSETILPDFIRDHPPNRPLRLWIAGCSSGEETYSLAMLFHEQIVAAKRDIKLQVFASDADPDAVASAREGLYSVKIEADVSSARLARFFSKEGENYRVLPELRASVIFTVQDLLADPPFSRLDFVSCRNLLIYLLSEAQAKIVSLFHFALREGGILLLGSSETISNVSGRFEVLAKSERLYRRVGRNRSGDFGFQITAGSPKIPVRHAQSPSPVRQTSLADLCRRLVIDSFAPAALLINRKCECLYFLGPTDRYLAVAPGRPAHDLLSMAREGVRTKLRSAIQRACQDNTRVVTGGGRISHNGEVYAFSITVEPVLSDGEELLLICFLDEPTHLGKRIARTAPENVSRVAELEQELKLTRMELQGAIRNLESTSEEQKAINEEALSTNEEYQSTNEELLASKEELQSLNEELTALNSQLQETLERQRTTADDLQNVLYSTNVATLFLDTKLNIRFFTPATKSLFNVIPSDVGRPLADLRSASPDDGLLDDARTVLENRAAIEREIQTRSGAWFIRRVLPYRTQDNRVEGIVITFADISERRRAAEALGIAKRQAELASVAKSRFLAAASHDLRQPLQTLALLQGLLLKVVVGERAQKLVSRIDETLSAMSGMLNALLNINQIEAGTVRAEVVSFQLGGLFDRLRDQFIYNADAKKLSLRVMPCSLSIKTDPNLLEQMIRNLLSNALKYTKHGKVLVGCRRRKDMLRIEIWDTGVGIPNDQLHAIFEEYHQLDNPARERSRGLGLGLSIVKRLAGLLGHHLTVHSRAGQGSVFAIEVELAPHEVGSDVGREVHIDKAVARHTSRTGQILVVEDDPEVRELMEILLKDEGYLTAVAPDGIEALELVERGTIRPDLILADYNLPNGMDGLAVAVSLRRHFQREIPVIILTGDISTETLRSIALQECIHLNKPVKLEEMTQAIRRLLSVPREVTKPQVKHLSLAATSLETPTIFIVDDDALVREGISAVLEQDGRKVKAYSSCEAFLEDYRSGEAACLLIDAYLPGMSGLELLQKLHHTGNRLPAIMITGNSDVPMAVQAMKAGASDFVEKPIGHRELLTIIDRALEQSQDVNKLSAWRATAANHIAVLTPRQREIMQMVLAGHPSKNIAADLGISQRTVENHRASIMKKTGSKSLPALARLAMAAADVRTG